MKLSFDQMQKILDDYKAKKHIGDMPQKDSEKILSIMQKLLNGTKEVSSFLKQMDAHDTDEYTGKCRSECVACRARQILQGDSPCDPKKTGPKSG
jgi:hypothetical protein